jgi:hypothetical protein
MQRKLMTSLALAVAAVFAASTLAATTADATFTGKRTNKSRDGIMRLGGPTAATSQQAANCVLCNDVQVAAFFNQRFRDGVSNGR